MNNVKLLHISAVFFSNFSISDGIEKKRNLTPQKKLKWRPCSSSIIFVSEFDTRCHRKNINKNQVRVEHRGAEKMQFILKKCVVYLKRKSGRDEENEDIRWESEIRISNYPREGAKPPIFSDAPSFLVIRNPFFLAPWWKGDGKYKKL